MSVPPNSGQPAPPDPYAQNSANQPYQQQAPHQQVHDPNGSYGTVPPPQAPPPNNWSAQDNWSAQGSLAGQGSNTTRLSSTDKSGLKALFDFNFDSYATPAMAKIIYTVAVVVAGLSWVGGIIMNFSLGAVMLDSRSTEDVGGMFIILGVLTLLFGWIVWLLVLAGVRMQIEFVLATVRSNHRLAEIQAELEKQHS